MPPQIRFFCGAHGQRLAYSVSGRGPLLVLPAWWVSHLERDWDDPRFRALFERLGSVTTVVRYDRPGVGLSDPMRAGLSLADELANLEALVAELGAESIALFGGSSGGAPAIAYAARHPGRTSHLVLYGAYASGPRIAADEVKRAVVGLVRAHWGLGSKALTDLFAPDCSADERERLAAMQRNAAPGETAAALLELVYGMDVSALLSAVRTPTLVIHRKGDRAIAFENGRELAAKIPGATFVPLEGNAHFPWLGDWESVAQAVLAFLGLGAAPPVAELFDPNLFVREGEVWSVAFAGKRCHAKHARGLADLAHLLARPGAEISAVQLMGLPDPVAPGTDPVLDERARTQLRQRIRALDEAIARVEADGNEPAATRATDEKEALVHQLRVATGLGGRARGLADPSERARKAVTARIRESIDKLRAPLPELARHLDESITTGTFCAYTPARPLSWRT